MKSHDDIFVKNPVLIFEEWYKGQHNNDCLVRQEDMNSDQYDKMKSFCHKLDELFWRHKPEKSLADLYLEAILYKNNHEGLAGKQEQQAACRMLDDMFDRYRANMMFSVGMTPIVNSDSHFDFLTYAVSGKEYDRDCDINIICPFWNYSGTVRLFIKAVGIRYETAEDESFFDDYDYEIMEEDFLDDYDYDLFEETENEKSASSFSPTDE